jgi:hypothetical protein
MKIKRGDNYEVYKRGADGRPEGKRLGKHRSEAKADAQLVALHAAMQREKKKMSKYADLDFQPTPRMAKAAEECLALAEGGVVEVPAHIRALATSIAGRQLLSPRSVQVMLKTFDRCDDAAKGWGDKSNPSMSWVKFMAYGGLSGVAWARKLSEQMLRIDSDTATKTVNVSDAGAGGFGVVDDKASEVMQNMPTKYNLDDDVVHVPLGEAGTVSGVIRQKSGAVVYHIALKSGGLAVATTEELSHDEGEGKTKSIQSVLTKLRFLHSLAKHMRPINYRIMLAAIRDVKKTGGQIPLLKRMGWQRVKHHMGKIERLIDFNRETWRTDKGIMRQIFHHLSEAIDEATHLKHFALSIDAQPEEIPEEVIEEEPVEEAQPALSQKAQAIKSLQVAAQEYTDRFGQRPPSEVELFDALDTVYDLAEVVLDDAELREDEKVKALGSAIYAEVDQDSAAAWARRVLDSLPALDETEG